MTEPLAAATTHAVCCDFTTSLCGQDVTDDVWGHLPFNCPLCAIAAMEHLPCANPNCPDREGWLLPHADREGYRDEWRP